MTEISPASIEFEEKEVEVRGLKFRFRELSGEEYDDCLKKATKADDDIDMVLLLKLMVIKCLKEPTMSAEQISKLPYRVTREMGNAVNDLHFTQAGE